MTAFDNADGVILVSDMRDLPNEIRCIFCSPECFNILNISKAIQAIQINKKIIMSIVPPDPAMLTIRRSQELL